MQHPSPYLDSGELATRRLDAATFREHAGLVRARARSGLRLCRALILLDALTGCLCLGALTTIQCGLWTHAGIEQLVPFAMMLAATVGAMFILGWWHRDLSGTKTLSVRLESRANRLAGAKSALS